MYMIMNVNMNMNMNMGVDTYGHWSIITLSNSGGIAVLLCLHNQK